VKRKNIAEVLIVDDEPMMCNLLRLLVDRAGHHVSAIAKTGEQAISLFNEHEPDIVTMDLRLPDLDGLEVMKRMKAISDDIDIIVITGDEQGLHGESLDAGASAVISKPFEKDEFIKVLNDLVP
jgi:two-component system chemotaxis response regulator CheY